MRRARSARRSLFIDGLLWALLVPVVAAAKPQNADPEKARDAERLARENAVYRRELDLATSESFYYVLDPRTHRLRFMYQGNLLHEHRLLDVEMGMRRGLFGSGSPPSDWAERIWSEGELDPPRIAPTIELDASAENYQEEREAVLVPPTPEEAYPAPAVWRIRYQDGLSLEFHGVADTTRTRPNFGSGIGRWFADAFGGLLSPGKDAVRIRLYMPRLEADQLYRGVPPGTRFTLLPHS